MVHINDFGGLPDDSAVDHGLVVWFYCGRMVKDHYFCLKVKYRLRIRVFVNQNHTLAEVRPF